MPNILHVDLNAFYASVEQALNKELKNKPIAVAGDPKKRNGIILTASYEARKYGVKTAMTIYQVKELCPNIIFIKPSYSKYFEYSSKVMNIIKSYSPLYEVFSIDEAWIDVTGCEKLFGDGVTIAYKIKDRIKSELDITASVGVSYCKLMAKMASDLKKPDAVSVVMQEDIKSKIWPLTVRDLIGVGKKVEPKLNNIGIYTIGDLARSPLNTLEKLMGKFGRYLWYFANGIDNSRVDKNNYECNIKGIGNSTTTPKDLLTYDEIYATLLSLCESVACRLREGGFIGKVVEIQIKGSDFHSIVRQKTLKEYTNITKVFFLECKALFNQNWNLSMPVRLLGVRISRLKNNNEFKQISFFNDNSFNLSNKDTDIKLLDIENINTGNKMEKVDFCLDEIRRKYGYSTVFKASLMINDTKLSYLNDEEWVPMKTFKGM